MSNLYDILVSLAQVETTEELVVRPQTIILDPKKWMEEILGFTDNPGIFSNAKSQTEKNNAIYNILQKVKYNEATGMLNTSVGRYKAGWFISPTVNEIIDTISKLDIAKGTPILKVIQGKDVGEQHLNATNLETFQGASQFNALEMADFTVTPYDGIANYSYDNTQGPTMAISTLPGTFIRNYWLTHKYGQQFNALDNMGLKHINGYLIWDSSPENVLNMLNVGELKIPCMLYTQVAGITKSNNFKLHSLNKLVHQIYSAAVPINTYQNSGDVNKQLCIAKQIIESQYIGVIGIGLLLHHIDKSLNKTNRIKPIINLTLIGAGVFNVPEKLVLQCMHNAINKFITYDFDLHIHGYSVSTANNISKYFNPISADLSIKSHITNIFEQHKYINNEIVMLHQPDGYKMLLFSLHDQNGKRHIGYINSEAQTIYIENRIENPIISEKSMINHYDYKLIIENDDGVHLYDLREYQHHILNIALSIENRFVVISNNNNLYANVFSITNSETGIKSIGFISISGEMKFFVNLKQDYPHLKVLSNSSNSRVICDNNGNKITSWIKHIYQ